jgi:hypothetical protein
MTDDVLKAQELLKEVMIVSYPSFWSLLFDEGLLIDHP